MLENPLLSIKQYLILILQTERCEKLEDLLNKEFTMRILHCALYSWNAGPGVSGNDKKVMTIEQSADITYSDKKVLNFGLIFDKNYYTNLKSLHLCFPIRFRKLSNAAQNLDLALFPVNNFFAHWIKKIDILKYGTNKSLI